MCIRDRLCTVCILTAVQYICSLSPCALVGIKTAKEKGTESSFHLLDEASQKGYEHVLTKAPQLQNIHAEDL